MQTGSKRSKRWLVNLIVAIVVVGGVILYLRSHNAEEGAQAAQKMGASEGKSPGARAVSVAIEPAATSDVPLWLDGLGSVVAWQQVTVRPQVDGRLDRVFFKEGQAVKKGQVLAQIDPRPFTVQLHQAEGALARDKSQMADARLNLDRYKTLVSQKLIAQQQVDDQAALVGQSEGAVHADEAAVESAKLNLDYAAVKSPLDGVVGVRLVDPGNLVHAADVNGLVVITQLDPAALFVTLPEDDLGQIMEAKQRGDVPVEAWSRDGAVKLGTGKLIVVDNQINATTATLRLKCEIPNPDSKLWPNQFVKARLLLGTRKGALVIAPAAVQRGPQGTFVYVVENGKAELRPVVVAMTTADVAVIDKGLVVGEQVVVEGQNQLRPGSAVNAHPLAAAGGGAGGGGEHKAGAPRQRPKQ